MADAPAVPDMRLELVPIPVSDVDRAKAFYQQVGFGNMHEYPDHRHDAGCTANAARLKLRHCVRDRDGPDHRHAPRLDQGPSPRGGRHDCGPDRSDRTWHRAQRGRRYGRSPLFVLHRSGWKHVGSAAMAASRLPRPIRIQTGSEPASARRVWAPPCGALGLGIVAA